MKLWSQVCFLVLGISSISRGQNTTLHPIRGGTAEGTNLHLSLTRAPVASAHENETEAPQVVPSSTSSLMNMSANTTDPNFIQPKLEGPDVSSSSNTTEAASSSKTAQFTTSTSAEPPATTTNNVTVVSTATQSTSSKPGIIEKSSPWGYVILVLIILMILILVVILYFLRRVSRTYSFDLQRPSPINRLNEPTGTFEPVYLDDLDRPVPKDEMTTDDLSPPPVANGTSPPSEQKGSRGETALQEQPDGNHMEPSAVTNASPTPAEESADKVPSPPNSTSLFLDAVGEEQQNENNNQPSVCSSDPFVEINLDEPAPCDQLLTSAEATSSVLPFSPFFSSSSSS